MGDTNKYNLFISHAWDYNDEYYNLVNKLEKVKSDESNDFDYINYSVPSHDPVTVEGKSQTERDKILSQALYNQIRPTHVVLILAGMYVNHRDWILKELGIAKGFNKPILAIQPWGSERMPVIVQDYADEIVGWNTPTIVSAIQRLSHR